MSEKSWASLAPLLDNRRYMESIVAGIKVKAHPDFRLVSTMNDDASTFELPEYIHSRLQPQIWIDFPERDEEYQILKENLPFAEDHILEYVTDFLAARARIRRALHGARRDQHRPLRDQTREPRDRARARDQGAAHRDRRDRGRRGAALRSGELTAVSDDARSLDRGRFLYFPVAPGRMEFAHEVRRALLAACPDVVAVELPLGLREAYLQAVQRLPRMSVLFYAGEEEDRAIYVPVEPADPFTEAIRTGLEIGAEILFADPDVGERPHLPDAYPDTYSIRHIGIDKYVEAYRVYPQGAVRTRLRVTPPASPGSCKAPIRWREWCSWFR